MFLATLGDTRGKTLSSHAHHFINSSTSILQKILIEKTIRHKTGLRITLAESRTLQSKALFSASYKFRFHWLIAIIFMENKANNLPDFRYLSGGPSPSEF
jgi:hypothetical protein